MLVFQGDGTGLVACSVEEDVLLCELGNPLKSKHTVEKSRRCGDSGTVHRLNHLCTFSCRC